MSEFERIERRADLEALAKGLLRERVLAIDTEADSFYHYFDKTCLVQISTRDHIYLVDPLAMDGPADLAPLGPVMASPRVRKIFHAAEYDIFVLKRDCGFEFSNLFDTMISAQLLGYSSVGLAALIERHFDVSLPKDEQRSDWSARPLRDSQLSYAAADVTYLLPVAEILEAELRRLSRWKWAQEEFAALVEREWPARTFDKLGYLRIKGAKGLDPVGLSVLRELYRVRDGRAREIDRPPFKVLGNRALIEIGQQRPAALEELGQIKGVTDLIIRRLGKEILAAVERGSRSPHGPIPKRVGGGRRRLDRRTERRMTRLKRWRSTRAKELELDPGVLCPNATLEAVAWSRLDSPDDLVEIPELKRWFVREFGKEVFEVLAERNLDGAG